MNELEIGVEYVFVFKSENIKGHGGTFAASPTMSETLQGVVKEFDSKQIVIKTTKEDYKIKLKFGVLVNVSRDKISYWFQAPEKAEKGYEGANVIIMISFLLLIILFPIMGVVSLIPSGLIMSILLFGGKDNSDKDGENNE